MATLSSQLIVSLLDRASGPARGISGALARLSGQVERMNRQHTTMLAPMTGMAGRLLAFGGAYVGVTEGIRGTAGAALSFEAALSDVRKVVDATDEQFANMRRDIVGLSREMPVTAEGFASIYAAAAQSGIAQNELKSFSEGVVRMSTAWDTAVDATGESLAKIKTALGRDIAGTMALGDAINHVSNTSAASARDMLEFTNRVASFAETAGFSAEQALAFGGAMVGSGFEPEVAATSFRNLTKALTTGTRATKAQRGAFKALGLDATKTAKNMQKNAVGTTLEVIDRIKKLPEWQQISIASALFGDEARGLAPLFRDATELRRLLVETGDAARYSGSAFKEYVQRASTTGNVLQILKNKVADLFRGFGDDMLPSIKEGALAIGHVLDTLDQRAGVFDRLAAASQGFAKGLGYEGGVREAVEGLGDLLFGKADGSGAADALGRIFNDAKGWGESLRSLNDAIKESALSSFLASVGGYGASLAVSAVGLSVFAGAVSRLAAALYLLTGVKAAVGILRLLSKGYRLLPDGTLGTGATSAEVPKGPPKPPVETTAAPKRGANVRGFARGGIIATIAEMLGELAIDKGFEAAGENVELGKRRQAEDGGFAGWWKNISRYLPSDLTKPVGEVAKPSQPAASNTFENMLKGMNGTQSGGNDVAAELRSITMQTRSVGVSDVNVTNPVRPNVTVSVSQSNTFQSASDPAAAAAMGRAVGDAARSAVESVYSDGGM